MQLANEDALQHPSPSEFAFAVSRVACAHMALGVSSAAGAGGGSASNSADGDGFSACDTEALDLLSDVVGRYMESIGLHARENANAAGRTRSNAYDVLNALGCLSPRPLSVRELYAHAAESGLELPFDRAVPEFPARKKNGRRGRAYGAGVSPVGFHSAARPPHVPPFLPPFPANQHATLAARPPSKQQGGSKRGGGSENRRLKRIRQQQAAQAALAALHGSGHGVAAVDAAAAASGAAAAGARDRGIKNKRSKLRHQQIGGGVGGGTSSGSGSGVSVGAVRLDAVQKGILDGTIKKTKGRI
jgi:hypothetical protein